MRCQGGKLTALSVPKPERPGCLFIPICIATAGFFCKTDRVPDTLGQHEAFAAGLLEWLLPFLPSGPGSQAPLLDFPTWGLLL